MNRWILLIAACALAGAIACSREEAKDAAGAAGEAADAAKTSATKMAGEAATAAKASPEKMAGEATGAVEMPEKDAAPAVAAAGGAATAAMGDAVAACRALAQKGAFKEALAVCEKAHEMLPDDMAIEHAYQQAKAAAE